MNQQAYESGRLCYQNADWRGAAAYLSQAKGVGEVSGEVDHLLGNALMKLGQYDQAAAAYGQALQDQAYGKKGALSANRGRALLAAGRPQDAVGALTEAVADPSYTTPYKAYMALGSAYERLGDVRNAGIAYRSAAIDEANPAPSVALCDLGSCFMRLGRSVDAVEAYRTALDFTTPLESQNQIWCDLGLAYVAANRMNEAVDAFSHATADGSFTLPPEARASYEAASKAVAAIGERRPSETDAFLAAAGYGGGYDPLDPMGSSGELIPSPEDTGFFSVAEEDLVQQDLADRKVRRKHGHTGLKVLIVVLVLLVALAGGAFFAYSRGYGWPTQEAVAQQLFDAKSQGKSLAEYVVSGTSATQLQEMNDTLPSGATVEVKGVDKNMTDSTVYAVAKLAEGGEQAFDIAMKRDGIGWKVVSVTPDYSSAGGSDSADATNGSTAPTADATTTTTGNSTNATTGTDVTSGSSTDDSSSSADSGTASGSASADSSSSTDSGSTSSN